MKAATANFRSVLHSAARGERLIPLLRAYLYNPRFPSFEVDVAGFKAHPPDGWFHPSTHPLWTERMLYYYLTEPEQLAFEPFDPKGTLAVTAGHFWHKLLQTCMDDMGILVPVEKITCKQCGAEPTGEPHVCDLDVGSRGNMDGILVEDRAWPEEVLEIKTADPRKLNKINSLEDLIEKCPDYYLQGIEYLRLSGYSQMRLFIMGLILPYDMREIVVPFDPIAAKETRDKYMRVRQAVADQRPPMGCCSPRSTTARECVARMSCPIGLIR